MNKVLLTLIIVVSVFFVFQIISAMKTSDIETPKYEVVKTYKDFELRQYEAMLLATTNLGPSSYDQKSSEGFRTIASYIFGKNQTNEKIAMTAPVIQTPSADGTWLVRFIMPEKYTLETLPRAGSDDVRLLQVPPTRRAAIRFSGVATDASIAANEKTLREWLAARNIVVVGVPTYAYYNDPFTPGPLRRNEVLFDVTMP